MRASRCTYFVQSRNLRDMLDREVARTETSPPGINELVVVNR